ncbi:MULTISPECIES: hypothetical protein [unclassified Ancylobacter]|jgi:hypothetical protein|uniref:hypothetical protein n=1 Tax=unclassified Ancylobacter TaxID=2626613 RepID=UPI0022712CE6|nr:MULTISPECIES: hypothetical protein [unclassified Ancylobacter]WAC27819.1 hypothetical protein OU996_01680 [Ancylobacter sp. SL191]WGD29908.1 hypothetical protein AncyloWKF20_19495 [Ancylobacter sp. WKF20]
MAGRFDDWDKDDKGHLKVWPMQAFTTALFGTEKVGLRIEIGTSAPKPGEPVPALQLVLDPAQVRQLAEALAEAEARLADAHFTALATSRPGNA